MTEENVLQKTNRMNLLFDFYQRLLTEKQQMFMRAYFYDDFSLGEIASEFHISRQAVYEHIKRAEAVLEEMELKLRLLAKHEERQRLLQQLADAAAGLSGEQRKQVLDIQEKLLAIDEDDEYGQP